VLLVDDEPAILTTLSAILENQRFSVRVAEDGFAALKTLRETLPDIIVSDLRMPNMSGFEFLSIVRRRFPHIPVIVISGEFIVEGLATSLLADFFFQKGHYSPEDLLSTIRQLVVESPIRPHLNKSQRAPVWIPLRDAGYFVATCTDCLRSFPVEATSTGHEVHRAECPSCGTTVEYHCCPVKSRTESIGCWNRVSQCRSLMREVPAKWAFSRIA
jgi:CheY-like chemotaxis protein